MAEPLKPPTPQQKTAARVGPCLALGCRTCDEFRYDRTEDSFRTCACGHTQQIHDSSGLL